jgi:hypothetical protein
MCGFMSYRIVRGDYFQIYMLWPGREVYMWAVPVAFAVVALGSVVLDELLQLRRYEQSRTERRPYGGGTKSTDDEHIR